MITHLHVESGDDSLNDIAVIVIFINFPLIDWTSFKMLSQHNLQVPSRPSFCFNLIASKNKK